MPKAFKQPELGTIRCAMPTTKSYRWISLWFLFSYGVVLWDLAYILLRPHSLPDGKFRRIWSVYEELEAFDKVSIRSMLSMRILI